MKIVVKESKKLKGEIKIPSSKSHGWRILFLSALTKGKKTIIGAKESSDWFKAVESLRMFGINIERKEEQWIIHGKEKNFSIPDDVINCGNSGPLLRYFGILAAVLSDRYTIITGDYSLRHNRLADSMVEAVNQLGGWAVCTKGDKHAPIIVKGKINGGSCLVDGSESQIVSALLIGAALSIKDTEIFVKNPGEKPWVELTIYWLKKFGIEVKNIDGRYNHYIVTGGQKFTPLKKILVPLDWQTAPTVLLAGIINPNSEITINNIDYLDPCPDRLVIPALQKMGAKFKIRNNSITAYFSGDLKGIKVDANDFTDQFVPLAIAAAFAKGTTVISNNEIQRHKECDRIKAVSKALKKMGVKVIEKKDGLIIKGNGGRNLKGTKINCYKDHRMVSNFAVAGMRAEGKTILTDGESLDKTFHNFVSQFSKLGADIKCQN